VKYFYLFFAVQLDNRVNDYRFSQWRDGLFSVHAVKQRRNYKERLDFTQSLSGEINSAAEFKAPVSEAPLGERNRRRR
jgi:hypothetical protein